MSGEQKCGSSQGYIHHHVTSAGLGYILLDRPASLNALDVSMVEDMYTILMNWKIPGRWHPRTLTSKGIESSPRAVFVMSQDAYSRYILLENEVPLKRPYFCAGGDVKQVVERGMNSNDIQWGLLYFTREYFLDFLISRYPLPYVALMDGITFGGGVGLSIHGRYQVATENTVFSMPECAIGLFPDVGGSYFLSRIQGGLGLYLGLTGARLYGQEVKRAGLATHYIHSSLLPSLFEDLNKSIASCQTDTTHGDICDEMLLALLNVYDTKTANELCVEENAPHTFSVFDYQQEIDDIFGWKSKHDSVESIVDTCRELAKMSPFFQTIVDSLEAASPLSLKLTFQQLRLGRTMPLAECFRMDNRIIRRLTEDTTSDFYVGVTNKLLRKSNKPPQWNMATLGEVDDTLVEKYIAPLDPAEELQLQSWITKL